jgi:hypothetical protein
MNAQTKSLRDLNLSLKTIQHVDVSPKTGNDKFRLVEYPEGKQPSKRRLKWRGCPPTMR